MHNAIPQHHLSAGVNGSGVAPSGFTRPSNVGLNNVNGQSITGGSAPPKKEETL
jgi:hypothetical protein